MFIAAGNDSTVSGQDNVQSLYRFWSETNQSIFFVENEGIAVADHLIASVAMMQQQVSGKIFRAKKLMAHLLHVVSTKILEGEGLHDALDLPLARSHRL